jgi:hypothetical protein
MPERSSIPTLQTFSTLSNPKSGSFQECRPNKIVCESAEVLSTTPSGLHVQQQSTMSESQLNAAREEDTDTATTMEGPSPQLTVIYMNLD